MPFTITVKTLDGATQDYEVTDETTVGQFKATLTQALNIPTEEQRLIFQGRVLQNDAKLSEQGCSGKVLHLVRRMPQPQQQQPSQQESPQHQQQHMEMPDVNMLPNHIAQIMEQVLTGMGGVGQGASFTTRQQPNGGVDVVVNLAAGGRQQSLARLRLGYLNTVLRQMDALLAQLDRVRAGEADGPGEVRPDVDAVRLVGNPHTDRIPLPEVDRVGADPAAPADISELSAAIDRVRRGLAALDAGLATWSAAIAEHSREEQPPDTSAPAGGGATGSSSSLPEEAAAQQLRRRRRQAQHELAARAAHLGSHALHNLSDLIAEIDGAERSRNLLVLSETPVSSIQAHIILQPEPIVLPPPGQPPHHQFPQPMAQPQFHQVHFQQQPAQPQQQQQPMPQNPLAAHLRSALHQSLQSLQQQIPMGPGGGAPGTAPGLAPTVATAAALHVDPFLNCVSRHFMPARHPHQHGAQPRSTASAAATAAASASPRSASNSAGAAGSRHQQPPGHPMPNMFEHILGGLLSGGAPTPVINHLTSLFGSAGEITTGENFVSDLLTIVLSNGRLTMPDVMTLLSGDGSVMDSSRLAVQDYLQAHLSPEQLENQLDSLRPLLSGASADLPVLTRPPAPAGPGSGYSRSSVDEILVTVVRQNTLDARSQILALDGDSGFGRLLLEAFNRIVDELVGAALKLVGQEGSQRMAERLIRQYMLVVASAQTLQQPGQPNPLGTPEIIEFCGQVLSHKIQQRLRSVAPAFPACLLQVKPRREQLQLQQQQQQQQQQQEEEEQRQHLPLEAAEPQQQQPTPPPPPPPTSPHVARVLQLISQPVPDIPDNDPLAALAAFSFPAAAQDGRLPAELAAIAEADASAIRLQQPQPRPLSDAYCSQQPYPKRRRVAAADGLQNGGPFRILERLLAETTAQTSASATPAAEPQDAELRSAFLGELLRRLRRRVATDSDFEAARFPSTARHMQN